MISLGKLSLICVCFMYASSIFVYGETPDNIFDDLMGSYDKRVRPKASEHPEQVNLTAHILSVEDLDEEKHEFTMTLYLRHYWLDPRLRHASSTPMHTITLDDDEEKKLWLPDTFIVNSNSYEESNSFSKISDNGDVMRSAKVTVVAKCKMTFGYFPHDRHVCNLDFESYGHNDDDIVIEWKDGPESVTVADGASPPNFVLGAFNALESDKTTGNNSRISLQIYMIRKSNRQLQTLYFPALAITITSFFTLWAGTRQSRIQISVICLLAMFILMELTLTRLPYVSFQTAVEHYHFLCANLILNVVFVNFLLYNFLNPRQGYRGNSNGEMKEMKLTNGVHEDAEKDDKGNEGPPYVSTKFQKFIYTTCKKTKWHMPIVFLIFNVIYFAVVIIASSGYPAGFTHLHNQH